MHPFLDPVASPQASPLLPLLPARPSSRPSVATPPMSTPPSPPTPTTFTPGLFARPLARLAGLLAAPPADDQPPASGAQAAAKEVYAELDRCRPWLLLGLKTPGPNADERKTVEAGAFGLLLSSGSTCTGLTGLLCSHSPALPLRSRSLTTPLLARSVDARPRPPRVAQGRLKDARSAQALVVVHRGDARAVVNPDAV